MKVFNLTNTLLLNYTILKLNFAIIVGGNKWHELFNLCMILQNFSSSNNGRLWV